MSFVLSKVNVSEILGFAYSKGTENDNKNIYMISVYELLIHFCHRVGLEKHNIPNHFPESLKIHDRLNNKYNSYTFHRITQDEYLLMESEFEKYY